MDRSSYLHLDSDPEGNFSRVSEDPPLSRHNQSFTSSTVVLEDMSAFFKNLSLEENPVEKFEPPDIELSGLENSNISLNHSAQPKKKTIQAAQPKQSLQLFSEQNRNNISPRSTGSEEREIRRLALEKEARDRAATHFKKKTSAAGKRREIPPRSSQTYYAAGAPTKFLQLNGLIFIASEVDMIVQSKSELKNHLAEALRRATQSAARLQAHLDSRISNETYWRKTLSKIGRDYGQETKRLRNLVKLKLREEEDKREKALAFAMQYPNQEKGFWDH